MSHLILQMNDRRAPIPILADDCWLSFFTIPVFKSNILPLKANTDCCELMYQHFHYEQRLSYSTWVVTLKKLP